MLITNSGICPEISGTFTLITYKLVGKWYSFHQKKKRNERQFFGSVELQINRKCFKIFPPRELNILTGRHTEVPGCCTHECIFLTYFTLIFFLLY